MVSVEWVHGWLAIFVAVLCTLLSTALSLFNAYRHLQNWTGPRSQRYIVRILLIAPVYAICSCIAVPLGESAVVAETVRDVFEAFIIYTFLALVLEYCGGDLNCVDRIKHDPPLSHPFPLCCLPGVRKDGRFLRLCKQGTLQFVVLKPIMGLVSLIMLARGMYYRPSFQAALLVVYNISYTLALYCLLLFYLATHALLKPHKPVLKFLSIKAMVFATYWQGLAVKLSPGISAEDATAWNNFILCVEMVIFSLALLLAFGIEPYRPKTPSTLTYRDKELWDNFREAITMRDIITDAYHNFVPTYQDYVLQNSATMDLDDIEDQSPNQGRAYLLSNGADQGAMIKAAGKEDGSGVAAPVVEMKQQS